MDKDGAKTGLGRVMRRALLAAGLLIAALILLFLIYPAPIHELIARVALDVEPLPPTPTSRADLSAALEKIGLLHTRSSARPVGASGQGAIVFSDEEMNSYVAYRMSRHRAGRLPAAVREAIDHTRIAFTDGGFRIEGNLDVAKLASYIEGQLGMKVPEPYRRYKTTFRVAGTIEAEGGLGRVAITEESLGRVPTAAGGLIPKVTQLARRLVSSTLIEDTLLAKVVSEEDLTFTLPPWIDGVQAHGGELEIILAPFRPVFGVEAGVPSERR